MDDLAGEGSPDLVSVSGDGNINNRNGGCSLKIRLSLSPEEPAVEAATVAAPVEDIFDFEPLETNVVDTGSSLEAMRLAAALNKKRGRPLGSKNRPKSRTCPGSKTPEGKTSAMIKAVDQLKTPPGASSVKYRPEDRPRKETSTDEKVVKVGDRQAGRQPLSLSFGLAHLGPKLNDLTRPAADQQVRRLPVAVGPLVQSRRLSESSDSSALSVLSSDESSRDNSAERGFVRSRTPSPRSLSRSPMSREARGCSPSRQLTQEEVEVVEITNLECAEVELLQEEKVNIYPP